MQQSGEANSSGTLENRNELETEGLPHGCWAGG
jgi:hypothetical protein